MSSDDVAAASAAGFRVLRPAADGPTFAELVESTPTLEDVCPGRRGCSLYLAPQASHWVPLARSTTSYARPLAPMCGVVQRVAEQLAEAQGEAPDLYNTALAETYDARYATMGYHSDQAQDLQPGTHIAVYSCYARAPADPAWPPRVLLVKPKAAPPGTPPWRVPLPHQAAVCFSLEANRTHVHSIRLNREAPDHADNAWYGLTLRRSRTFVSRTGATRTVQRRPAADVDSGGDTAGLHLASAQERAALLAARRRENREDVDGTADAGMYPLPCGATLSEGDVLPPL